MEEANQDFLASFIYKETKAQQVLQATGVYPVGKEAQSVLRPDPALCPPRTRDELVSGGPLSLLVVDEMSSKMAKSSSPPCPRPQSLFEGGAVVSREGDGLDAWHWMTQRGAHRMEQS